MRFLLGVLSLCLPTLCATAQTTCELVQDIRPGLAGSAPLGLTSADGRVLYFAANNGLLGHELWRSDATGTRLVKNIRVGSGGSNPYFITPCLLGGRSVILFRALDSNGSEPWLSDGTTAGTKMLKNLVPGSGGSYPMAFEQCGSQVFFLGVGADWKRRLWRTDGTAAGTYALAFAANQRPVAHEGRIYFASPDTATGGTEPWVSDGTVAGTRQLVDLAPGKASSYPSEFVAHGKQIAFRAAVSAGNLELFATDGTARGTRLVKDIYPGSKSSVPLGMTSFGGALWFGATDGTSPRGSQLWKSDLTALGTIKVKTVSRNTRVTMGIHSLTTVDDKLFFLAEDPGVSGIELWVTNGTTAGTKLVRDIYPGTNNGASGELVRAGPGVIFAANEQQGLRFLWFSDGTAAGTRRLCQSLRNTQNVMVCGDDIYFFGTHASYGSELFRLKGFDLGTVERVGMVCGRTHPQLDTTLVSIGKSMTLRGSSAPTAAGLLLVGLPAAPLALQGVVHPNCALRVDPTLFALVPQPAGVTWTVRATFPMQQSLVGIRFSMQSAYAPVPFTLSNAVQCVVGK